MQTDSMKLFAASALLFGFVAILHGCNPPAPSPEPADPWATISELKEDIASLQKTQDGMVEFDSKSIKAMELLDELSKARTENETLTERMERAEYDINLLNGLFKDQAQQIQELQTVTEDTKTVEKPDATPVEWMYDDKAAWDKALQLKRPRLAIFTQSRNCPPCEKLRAMFTDRNLMYRIKREYVPVWIQFEPEKFGMYHANYGIPKVPFVMLCDESGCRMIDPAAEFLNQLNPEACDERAQPVTRGK